ncbi:hypothetical protein ACFQ22_05645 [Lentilactobacillus raoultii]|uniref:Uncharacterized protein n=1 Tax=Lentilactobacillus raoultii TaxID=1987503 RepID=A0ABW3PDG8_9LACO|nr:hypothetical protein [Lentilactobacillus raoultii]
MADRIKPDDLLKVGEKIELTKLLDKSLHDPDSEKHRVYDALYTYFLDKRQDKIINRKNFIR